jgi:hypothetical protein
MADGFSVDRAALSETAQGINNTIGALKGLGLDETAELGGDPHLTDGQAAQASWSQDAAAITGAQTPGSGTTWAEAGQQADQQWTQVGRDELKAQGEAYRFLTDATGGAR